MGKSFCVSVDTSWNNTCVPERQPGVRWTAVTRETQATADRNICLGFLLSFWSQRWGVSSKGHGWKSGQRSPVLISKHSWSQIYTYRMIQHVNPHVHFWKSVLSKQLQWKQVPNGNTEENIFLPNNLELNWTAGGCEATIQEKKQKGAETMKQSARRALLYLSTELILSSTVLSACGIFSIYFIWDIV